MADFVGMLRILLIEEARRKFKAEAGLTPENWVPAIQLEGFDVAGQALAFKPFTWLNA